MIICVTLEGVLVRAIDRPLFECQTMQQGVHVANAFGEMASVAIVTSRPKLEVEPWLRARGPRYDILVGPWSGPAAPAGMDRVNRLQEIVAGGSRVSLAVEGNPTVAAAMLASGFAVLLAAYPTSQLQDWSFTPEPKPPQEWDELVDEIARQELETVPVD